MNGAKIDVCICTKNSERTIERCLSSIFAYKPAKSRVIVVDGESNDNTLKLVDKYPTLIISDGGKGLGMARKLGVEAARGEYIAFIDSDCEIKENWFPVMWSAINESPKIAGVEDSQDSGEPWALVSILETYSWEIYDQRRVTGKILCKNIGTRNSFWRKEAILSVGSFDEAFIGAREDGDISYRTYLAGWTLKKVPDKISVHHNRGTWKELWRQYYWWGQGNVLFNKKFSIRFPYLLFILLPYSTLKLALVMAWRKRDVRALFLLFHYPFKRLAWLSGFIHEYLRRMM